MKKITLLTTVLALVLTPTAAQASTRTAPPAAPSAAISWLSGHEAQSAAASPRQAESVAAENIELRHWAYVWQMWDGTQYRSHATCSSRGRQILRAYPDVQKFSCRNPPNCPGWRLFTYRKQWV